MAYDSDTLSLLNKQYLVRRYYHNIIKKEHPEARTISGIGSAVNSSLSNKAHVIYDFNKSLFLI